MIQFRLFGIPIGVHWMFFLLTAFIGGGLRADETSEWHRVIIFMVAAFISILVHELGHALTGLKLGASSTRIHLHGMGGAAQFPYESFNRKQNILVTAAGPAASILLAVLFFVIISNVNPRLDPQSYPSYMLSYFLATMVGVNVFWTIFNLCPILPLDGGQILRDLLGPRHIKISCIIGFITLAILAVLLWVYTRSIYNLLLILFLGTYTWKTWKQATNP